MLNSKQLRNNMASFKSFGESVDRPTVNAERLGLMSDTNTTAQSGTQVASMLGSLSKYVGGFFDSSAAIEAKAVAADTSVNNTTSMSVTEPIEFRDIQKQGADVADEEVPVADIDPGPSALESNLDKGLSALSKMMADKESEEDASDMPFLKSFANEEKAGEAIQGILDGVTAHESDISAHKDSYAEGATNYDAVYGHGIYGGTDKLVSNMTFEEVFDLQTDLIKASKGEVPGQPGKGSSAIGKYQLVKEFLFGKTGTAEKPDSDSWMAKGGFSAGDKFDAAAQERLGRIVLNEAGLKQFLEDKDMEAFQKRLSSKWASVQKPDGAGSYEGQEARTTLDMLTPYYKLLLSEKHRPKGRPANMPTPTGLMAPPRPMPRPNR